MFQASSMCGLPFSSCFVALLYFSSLFIIAIELVEACLSADKAEPLMRIELTTSSLPRKCSTTELQRLLKSSSQWVIGHWSRFSHWPTDLMTNDNSERKTRFEPATYSLEGCRSTNWATSALLLGKVPLAPDSYRDEIKIVSQFPHLPFQILKKRTVGKDGFEPPNS